MRVVEIDQVVTPAAEIPIRKATAFVPVLLEDVVDGWIAASPEDRAWAAAELEREEAEAEARWRAMPWHVRAVANVRWELAWWAVRIRSLERVDRLFALFLGVAIVAAFVAVLRR